ncbi:GNAT family N-acetyltransferase [Umezawaea sp. Da 62-37]|uniref:GNAT family N-acetyltransferase n=1 Tax=Umezawaea sp. Da 62-37 TaxID=3075927 RepID=UPI0028F6EE5F|nr:GNAT family N-acetyltransferase [Umezawaea sp. Da 62-37]WNV84166.1 GNAT family N-acetyltransferase [Umezawaea sp. Da 62-37]
MTTFLETDRLVLRRFTESDVDNLTALDSDPDVMRYLTGGTPTPRAEVENDYLPAFLAYYEKCTGFGFWAAEDKTGTFLGWFHFRPQPHDPPGQVELGYRLKKSAWGRGYATEGSKALVHKGFTDLDVDRVYAETMVVNNSSRRVMEKTGLKQIRIFHQNWPHQIDGSQHGEVEYAITKTEWQTNPKKPT